MRTDEIRNEIDEIKKRKDLKHKVGKYKYDFQKYETIRSLVKALISVKLVYKKLIWFKLISQNIL